MGVVWRVKTVQMKCIGGGRVFGVWKWLKYRERWQFGGMQRGYIVCMFVLYKCTWAVWLKYKEKWQFGCIVEMYKFGGVYTVEL